MDAKLGVVACSGMIYQDLTVLLQLMINTRNKLITCVEKKNQLDVTVCFIAFMIRSTYFGHFYAHHQEL